MTQIAKRRMTHSLSFDGVDDYVEVADAAMPASTFTGGFTLETWVLLRSYGEGGGQARIFDKSTGTSGQDGFDWSVYLTNGNTYFRVNAGAAKQSTADSLPLNEWTHLMVSVASDGTVTHYKNGAVNGTPADAGSLADITTTNALRIGNRSGATDRTFDGLMCDMRVHTSALSATQAEQLYQYALTHSPTHEYFNSIGTDGAGTVLTDSIGTAHGTISGATWSTEVPISESVLIDNVNTHALSFDGADDVTTIPDTTILKDRSVFTIDLLLSRPDHNNWRNLFSGGSGKSRFESTDDSSIIKYYGAGALVADGSTIFEGVQLHTQERWTLVADGTAVKTYINGVLNKSLEQTGVWDNDNNLYLGARYGATTGQHVIFYSVRASDMALTPQQVYDLHYSNVVPRENLVAEYLLNEGTGTTATDSAGDNDGTISGATWVPASEAKVAVPSEVPHVLGFDNNSQTIIGGNVGDTLSEFTILCKAKLTKEDTSDADGLVWKNNQFGLRHSHTANQMEGFTNDGGYDSFKGTTKIELNRMYTHGLTNDGVTSKLYLDGLLDGQEAQDPLTTSTENIYIGSQGGDLSRAWGGDIVATLLYDRALTAQEMYDYHHHNIIPTTGLVGNWNEISDDGTTLIDSVNGNDGTITGATRVTTLAGIPEPQKAIVPWVGSVEFDASGDNVDLGADFITAPFTYRGKYFIRDTGAGFVLVDSLSGGEGFRIESNSNRRLRVYNATANSSTSNYAYEYNKWFDLCVVLESDGSTNVYVDSILIKQFSLGMYVAGTTNLLHIGNRLDLARGDWGRCAGARIYKKALTTAEVEQLTITNTTPYDNDSSICVLNLEAKTDLLSGSTWKDASGNNNDGTITGATLSAERPHGNRGVNDGNLMFNGDFSVRPYLVAATTSNNKWINGTTAGGDIGGDGGKLYGWSHISGTSAQFDDGAMKVTCADGSTAEVCNVGANTATEIFIRDMKLKPSTQYTLTYKMKTDLTGDSNDGAYPTLTENTGSGSTNVTNNGTKVKGVTDWTEYSLVVTTHANTRFGRIRLLVTGNTGTGTLGGDAWFSDITLTEV